MTEPIEDLYFFWLCAKVITWQPHNPNYHDLFRVLHAEEFVWLVVGDHNRAEDGKELRIDFLRQSGIDPHEEPFWFDGPCSVFEMLIAFAKKAEFQTDIPTRRWFWIFMENLGLNEFRRITERRELRHVEEILHVFLNREYGPDGHGGILPMLRSNTDQRKDELWKQFFAYIDEQGL